MRGQFAAIERGLFVRNIHSWPFFSIKLFKLYSTFCRVSYNSLNLLQFILMAYFVKGEWRLIMIINNINVSNGYKNLKDTLFIYCLFILCLRTTYNACFLHKNIFRYFCIYFILLLITFAAIIIFHLNSLRDNSRILI